MPIRPILLATTAFASFGAVWLVVPGLAADMVTKAPALGPVPMLQPEPAVSAVNFKVEGFGGWLDGNGGVPDRHYGDGLAGGTAALTLPLANSFGFQVDGMAGAWSHDGFWGVAAHAFWRDPRVGLLGVTGSWTRLDRGSWPFIARGSGVSVGTVGAEGEYYWNAVTLRGVAGGEGGDVTSRFFSMEDVIWYLDRDFRLSVGHRYRGGLHAAALGGEWLIPTSLLGGRPALFAEARLGEETYRGVWGGLRVYFGPSRTLIDKQRRDDPKVNLPDDLFAIQSFVATLDKRNKAAEFASISCTSCTSVSDVRLKRDIVLLERLDNGLGLYRYRYLWDDTVYVGVMAQEVAALVPDAVRCGTDGYLRVDYARLGLRLLTWDAWLSLSASEKMQVAA